MHRRRNILRVTIFLELMMEHDLFYDDPNKKDNHLISNWPIVEPRGLQRQRTRSNDCGVWVCEWMSKCGFVEVEDYIEVHVWPSTRIRFQLIWFLLDSTQNSTKYLPKQLHIGRIMKIGGRL